MSSSRIASQLAVDPPVELDANFRLDETDRRYIDDQTRGCEQHLVDLLLSGCVCSWFRVNPSTPNAPLLGIGAVLCCAGTENARDVDVATVESLQRCPKVLGIQMSPAMPGSLVRVALFGIVPSAVTGLPRGGAGTVYVDLSTGRLTDASNDYPVGVRESHGHVTLGAVFKGNAHGGSGPGPS